MVGRRDANEGAFRLEMLRSYFIVKVKTNVVQNIKRHIIPGSLQAVRIIMRDSLEFCCKLVQTL